MYHTPCLFTVVAFALGWQPAFGQEPPANGERRPVLVVRDNGKEVTVRDRSKELRHVLSILEEFPAEVRNAVPVVAQSPELPGKVLDLVKRNDTEYLDRILANYPADVQKAFRVLVPYPKAVETMALHTNLMSEIGATYKKEGLASWQALKVDARNGDESTDTSAAAWAKRLERNPVSLQQYLQASADLEKVSKKATDEQGESGLLFNKQKAVITISTLPTAALTKHVLANADLYPQTADEMFEVWLHSDSSTEFDNTVASCFEAYRRFYSDAFFRPEGRAERLRGAAQIGKKIGGTEFAAGQFAAMLKPDRFEVEAVHIAALQKYVDVKTEAAAAATAIVKPKVPRKVDEVVLANKPAKREVRVAVPNAAYRYYWLAYYYQPWGWSYPVYYQAYLKYTYQPPATATADDTAVDLSTAPNYVKPAVKTPGHQRYEVWYNYSTPWWATVPGGWPYGPIKPWWWWKIYYPGYWPIGTWYGPGYYYGW
jgi:hypothetical protein